MKGYFKRKMKMKKMLVPLCKNIRDRYHSNILRTIAIIYHIYIESELYNLAYEKNQSWPHKMEF